MQIKSVIENPDKVAERYTVKTTVYLDSLMDHDAIARQYMPDLRELDSLPDENADPIGDRSHSPVKGIVHRYPDRVLLKPHHACAVYCRFCFRRDMVGRGGEVLNAIELDAALDYIRENTGIWEVILTGGDPLAMSNRRLFHILEALEGIDHVKTLRIHTRVPVADPARIDQTLCDNLAAMKKPLTVSVHCNHAAELTPDAACALQALKRAGLSLVSQSVLLKNINDSLKSLETLFRRLVECGVQPYYLHHPDKAEGTGHFRVTLRDGLALYRQLRGRLSGLCIPHYMLDIPGGYGKVTVDSPAVADHGNHYQITDLSGVIHMYKD